ncbi:LPS export ABC transporter permease LptF [Nitrosovibrio sp. Nv4]|uniref:LPS export ABC transporter permease LptF n=1 Tax=Nitrosovibrio sp. Nv4 TaxID=1945880 RepID=UPI000BCF7F44|nr:LPS export ABC transporter permease LptF [Nitrosovibrio sp. Nv4]SOD40623.1 lipopolysaccharide export system permease protein [Nitrosovibrio sp. Nv4]
MKIIERYITRELLIPFTVVATILAILFASFSSARFLAGAVTESLGLAAMLKLVLLKTLIALEVLMPISLYVAVVMGLGRLHRDQEIAVLRSAGVSESRIIYAILIVAIPVGIASGVLSIFVRPWAYEESYMLNAQAEAELNMERFQAGRFYGTEGKGRGRVVYIQTKDDAGNQVKDVFHYINESGSSELILAKAAHQPELEPGQRPQIHLLDGYIYRLMHSGTEDTVVQFDKLIYFTDSGNVLDYKRKAAPTAALMKSDQPRDIAEFQWRLSRPVATILLALIAVPFSRASPRQEKGERTYYAAALVFAIYYILNGLAQTWVEQGTIGSVPGVWWLYAVMLLIVLSLLSPRFWQNLFLRR